MLTIDGLMLVQMKYFCASWVGNYENTQQTARGYEAMSLTLHSWNIVVSRKYLRSSDFKNLGAAVIAYLQGKGDLGNLRSRWDDWESSLQRKGKTYKTSDRYFVGCALDDLAALVGASGTPSVPSTHAIPRSNSEVIRQRDAIDPTIRSGGNSYVKTSAGWKPKIFGQEENYSCTCACATTFLSKLVDRPVTETAFKEQFNSVNKTQHNFGQGGTLWEPILATLKHFNADVVFNTTSDWPALRSYLEKATPEAPVLFGIQWDNGGSPGGGHAIMCVGQGRIPVWQNAHYGFLIEDPWATHEIPGMIENQGRGWYYVWDRNSQTASEGWAKPDWGCITGKKSTREFGKMVSHKTGGVKLPGM